MYEENETLITTEDIGSEKKGTLIPKGSKVNFIRVADSPDLGRCLIAIRLGERVLVVPENIVKFKSWWKRRKAFKQFNNQFMISSPRLRRHHPNLVLKLYFRTYYFFKDLFGGKDEEV